MSPEAADPPQSAPDAGPNLVPQEVPWGIVEGIALLVLFATLQAGLAALLRAHERGLGPLVAVGAVSDVAILAIAVALVRTVRKGGRSTVREALGLVSPAREGLGPAARAAVAGGIAYVGLTRAAGAVLEYFDSSWSELPRQQVSRLIAEAEGGPTLVAAGLLAVALAPLAEEVLFRAMLYLPVRRRVGPVAAALVVGVVFSLCHFHPPGVLHLIVLSLVFTAAFEYTGSLWAAVVVHGAYNALELALLRLPELVG